MKRAILLFLLLAVAAYGATLAYAQGYNTGYTCKSTSVTSSTTPVTVLNVSEMTSWTIHARSGALGVLCFPYTAQAVPTAVPSPAAIIEIPAGANLNDAVTCDTNTCKDAIGAAWACVLTTGSTPVTVDSCFR